MRRKPIGLIAVLCAAAIAVTLAACGGDDETTTAAGGATEQTSTDETTTGEETTTGDDTTNEDTTSAASGGGTVDISETEYKLDPSDVTTKAGEVTFAISNDGSADHNLEIEGNGLEQVSDTIGGGESTELTVDLKAGSYEMYCAVDGHKDLGMEGEITVE